MKGVSEAKQRYYSGHPLTRVPIKLIPLIRFLVEVYRRGVTLTGDVEEDARTLLNAIAQ